MDMQVKKQAPHLLDKRSQSKSSNDIEIIDPTILVPIIAKLNRARRKEKSPLYDWTRIHLGLLHASPSTMGIMIQRNILTDSPQSLTK